VSLHATLAVADLRDFLAHWGQEFPSSGPLRGKGHLHDADGSLGLHDVELFPGDGEQIDLQVGGSFGDPRESHEVRFDAKLRAEDLRALGVLFDAELPAVGPVAVQGKVVGATGRVRADLTLRLDETEFTGDASAALPKGGRPRFTARLASPRLRLADVGFEPRPDAAIPEVGSDGADPAWWTDDRPIPLDRLRGFDADFELRAERITGRAGLDIRDARLALTLADGVLVVHDSRIGLESGDITLDLRVDASRSIPAFSATGRARGVDLTRLAAQLSPDYEDSGTGDLAIELTSSGRTVGELRSLLAGRVEARLRDGGLGTRLGREFVRGFTRVAIPGLGGSRRERFDCVAVALELEDGVARVDRLRIDGDRATVAGTGTVDFAHGAWDLRLVPRARDASLVSVAVAVDVSGPLDEPRFSPVARTAATSAARAVVDNVLHPARLVLRPFGVKAPFEESHAECPAPFDPYVPAD